jgi:hypothetical protein
MARERSASSFASAYSSSCHRSCAKSEEVEDARQLGVVLAVFEGGDGGVEPLARLGKPPTLDERERGDPPDEGRLGRRRTEAARLEGCRRVEVAHRAVEIREGYPHPAQHAEDSKALGAVLHSGRIHHRDRPFEERHGLREAEARLRALSRCEQVGQRAVELPGILVVEREHLGVLLVMPVPTSRELLDRLGDRAVKVDGPRVRERVEQRLPRQGMAKAIFAGALFDDPGLDAELQGVERRLRRETRGTLGDVESKAQPHECAGQEEAFRVASQSPHTVAYDVKELRRQRRLGRRFVTHRLHDLFGVEGIALGERVDGVDDARIGVAVQELRDEARRRLSIEPPQRHACGQALAADPAQHRVQGPTGVHVLFAEGPDEQEGQRLRRSGEVMEEMQARLVRLVEILHDQAHRPLGPERLDGTLHGLEEAQAVLLRRSTRRREEQEGIALGGGGASSSTMRPRIGERGVRYAGAFVEAHADENRAPSSYGQARALADEPRLSEARFTVHEENATATGEEPAHRRELLLPSVHRLERTAVGQTARRRRSLGSGARRIVRVPHDDVAALDRDTQVGCLTGGSDVEARPERGRAFGELPERVARSPRLREDAHEQLVRGLQRTVLREHRSQHADAGLGIVGLVVQPRQP